MSHEITSNGKTVWVNAPDGMCIGRFSRFGIDVHRNFKEQAAGMGECLNCTHELPDLSGWREFVDRMKHHHGVSVEDCHMPDFLITEIYHQPKK